MKNVKKKKKKKKEEEGNGGEPGSKRITGENEKIFT